MGLYGVYITPKRLKGYLYSTARFLSRPSSALNPYEFSSLFSGEWGQRLTDSRSLENRFNGMFPGYTALCAYERVQIAYGTTSPRLQEILKLELSQRPSSARAQDRSPAQRWICGNCSPEGAPDTSGFKVPE